MEKNNFNHSIIRHGDPHVICIQAPAKCCHQVSKCAKVAMA